MYDPTSSTAHSRLQHSNQIENSSKLDIQHRNSYNSTNHNRHPQIVIAEPTSPLHSYNRSAYGGAATTTHHPNIAGTSSSSSTNVTTVASIHHDISDPTYWIEADVYDSRRYTERRKKTVRFDGQDVDDWTRWESERQGSQDSATKDSGIDTSSTFTSSEDSNRGDVPKV